MKPKLKLDIENGVKPGPFEGTKYLIYYTKDNFDKTDLDEIAKGLETWRMYTTSKEVEVKFSGVRQNEGKTYFALTMKFPDLFLKKHQLNDLINQVTDSFSSFLNQRIENLIKE
ncbi:MAG: hypothetical protein NKF70_02910 [Methanobacterium sp. ERen5]|nr:MAG: hypothetical protein NKF70_02910 [Methanobacterium sp. ERen5]